ncbi:MAG: hypothetical protein AB1696_07750 [Planctomycetota bacterium]
MVRQIAVVAALFFFCVATSRADIVKKVLRAEAEGLNLLKPDAWGPWQKGFTKEGTVFLCDNGADAEVQRGASQTVELNQTRPQPIVASAWSKAENVGGGPNNDYSLYLDLVYSDGEPLWGQVKPFSVGSHDWERREVIVLPEKPVKSLSFHMLLRRHSGKAWFRDPALYQIETPAGSALFDGVPVVVQGKLGEGFQARDVAANSDFSRFEDGKALGLEITSKSMKQDDATFVDAELRDTTGKDRAVTLVYAIPVEGDGWQWLADPRATIAAKRPGEYMNANRFNAGANGRLSKYPFGAITRGNEGRAIGLDMGHAAFYRIGFNAATNELFIAYDIGFAPEKSNAKVRFCLYHFDPAWGFRGALAKYYEVFPDHFKCRIPEQGLWMPFAKISEVKGWEDFGFKIKEGNNETEWDDQHGIITFRYTEPMTWWMKMPKEMPRTMDAALAEAKCLAEKGDAWAKALLTSGYHDERGQFPARLLDTPWCNGAVWSMNSMPGIKGDITDFKNKWNAELREKLYGPNRKGDLDGEYVDSSEGYVTDELDFRRDHFAAAQTPLTFSPDSRKPAIFRGLVAYEYVRGIEKDVRAMGKLMMANGAPSRLCWLAPWLDVLGTETNWNHNKTWRPMSDADMLYRRSMCGPKVYCFLQNTAFEDFSHELVEKYMKRSLAYGMFPGFFSADASTGQYFKRPELYDRDRPLFKKYVPLCKKTAEAGWQPITLTRSSDPKVYVERFGDQYLTVFNDSAERREATITYLGPAPKACRDLVNGKAVNWTEHRKSFFDALLGGKRDMPDVWAETKIVLDGEDVAVVMLERKP